jgi:prephenate dehydratase
MSPRRRAAEEGAGARGGAAGERTPVGYLGPPGTFSEEALRASTRCGAVEPVPCETFREAIVAVRDDRLPWALVPIENSIEGPVSATLDTLAAETPAVAIAGELVLQVHHCLIATAADVALGEIATVLSHPQASGQCSLFMRRELPHARIGAATSTAEAVREVGERGERSLAAIGTALAASLYDCAVLRERIEDRPDNETRFVWIGRPGADLGRLPLRVAPAPGGARKTSLVFWGPGAERAGWLVRCLDELARRGINLTKIESRPRRERLGHYMFFADLEGGAEEERVAEALAGLGRLCDEVLVLGSYPAA